MPEKRAVRRVTPLPKDEEPDDEVSTPSRRSKTATTTTKPTEELRGGWSAGQEAMDSTSSFAQALKPEEKAVVIKFLDDEPYVSYRRHWIERTNANRERSVRSYTCLKSFKRDCPLCEAGDKAQAVSAFNVALVGDDGVVSIKSWDVGPKIYNILKGYANDPKIAPLTRGYFLVSRTGKKGSVNHQVIPVKPSALEEDYDIPAPSKEELDRLEKYDRDVVEVPSRKTLDEIAAEFSDDYT
jgi:hypothetical protein